MSPSEIQAYDHHFRHFAVTGDSLEGLMNFYGGLGFTERVAYEVPDRDYIQVLSGQMWDSARIAKLSNRDGVVLELIEPHFVADRRSEVAPSLWSHFAVTVECCHRAVAEIVDAGGTLVGGPTDNPDSPYRVAYARDPYGNLLELVEPLDGMTPGGFRDKQNAREGGT